MYVRIFKKGGFTMSEIKTRANIAPSKEKPQFDISTADCAEFIQEKFNRIVTAMRKAGNQNITNIQVQLITLKASNGLFNPFLILLPLDVLASNRKNSDELAIFNPSDEEGVQKLKNEFYAVLSPYMYNKADRNGFNSGEWKRALRVSNRVASQLHLLSTPRIQSVGGRDNKVEVVVLLLDPLRIMHDMLVDLDNTGERFHVRVTEVEHIQKGNYMYKVERALDKNNKKSNFKDSIINDINQAILGRY